MYRTETTASVLRTRESRIRKLKFKNMLLFNEFNDTRITWNFLHDSSAVQRQEFLALFHESDWEKMRLSPLYQSP
jgi:hypothetical protein